MDIKTLIEDLKNVGITIEEIAFRCRVTTRTVERWQQKEDAPSPTRANKIYLEQWHKRRCK